MTCCCEPPGMIALPGALTLSFCTRPSPRIILDDIFITTAAAAEVDDSFFLELPDNFNDPLLGGMNVLYFHRTHDFHFFLHHLDAAAGHIAEELLLLLVGSAFQRRCYRLLVDALQNLTNGRIVKHGNILEYEHQFADGICHFGLAAIHHFENRSAFAAVHPVEKFGDRANTAVRLVMGVSTYRLQFLLQHR